MNPTKSTKSIPEPPPSGPSGPSGPSEPEPEYTETSLNIFSKQDLLQLTLDLETHTVDLSSIGHSNSGVLIQELTAADRDYWEASLLVDAQEGNTLTFQIKEGNELGSRVAGEMMRSRMVALSLAERQPDGSIVKMYGKRGDEHIIKQWPAKLVNLIASEAMDLNGISPEDQDQIKKDLAQALTEDSSSTLVESSE